MESNFKIYMIDNIKPIRTRMKLLLETENWNVIEASNSAEFFYFFSHNEYGGSLIIMDIDLKEEDGFHLIREIREKNKHIPIIILTANKQRDSFVKGISEGATDYILQPFVDAQIKEKIRKILHSYAIEKTNDKIIFNLPLFLKSEFAKSRKGKYATSVMLTTLFKPTNTYSEDVDNDYSIVLDVVYNELKNIFWETDIFTKYGVQSFVGVFPFANKESVYIINNKINDCFIALKQRDESLNEYLLFNEFITYPEDVVEVQDVLVKLVDKSSEAIRFYRDVLQSSEGTEINMNSK